MIHCNCILHFPRSKRDQFPCNGSTVLEKRKKLRTWNSREIPSVRNKLALQPFARTTIITYILSMQSNVITHNYKYKIKRVYIPTKIEVPTCIWGRIFLLDRLLPSNNIVDTDHRHCMGNHSLLRFRCRM